MRSSRHSLVLILTVLWAFGPAPADPVAPDDPPAWDGPVAPGIPADLVETPDEQRAPADPDAPFPEPSADDPVVPEPPVDPAAEARREVVDALLSAARELEAQGRWAEAIEKYEDARREAGDLPTAVAGIARCRHHLRIEARCRSAGNREFVLGLAAGRGVVLYEELLDRIATSYVQKADLTPLVRAGIENCLAASANAVFLETYGAVDDPGRATRWRKGAAAVRDGLRGRHLTAAEAGQALRQVLKANVHTLTLPDGALILEMIHGAVEGLDPYSAFLNPQRLKALRTEIEGEFVGLGLRIAVRRGELVVVDPIDGGPAARAGVRAGDRLLAIDGRSTAGLSLEEAARLLQGPVNSAVVIEIHHEGCATPEVFTVRRARVALKSVTQVCHLGARGRVGYLRVSNFQKGTAAELEAAAKRLEAEKINAFILDLRGNPGGVLDAAVDVANAFMRHGVVVSTRGRAWGQSWTFRARAEGTHPDLPMAILIDDMSASASEIVAGALQDHRRAVLIGTRSYGKGSVQSLFKLGKGNVGLRLTTARFYAPSGRCFDGVGLTPDVEIKPRADLGHALPDDPSRDPQLLGAVRYLEARLLAGKRPAGAASEHR